LCNGQLLMNSSNVSCNRRILLSGIQPD